MNPVSQPDRASNSRASSRVGVEKSGGDRKSSIRSIETGELVKSDVSLTNVRKGNQLERALTEAGTQTQLYYERDGDRAPRIVNAGPHMAIPLKKG